MDNQPHAKGTVWEGQVPTGNLRERVETQKETCSLVQPMRANLTCLFYLKTWRSRKKSSERRWSAMADVTGLTKGERYGNPPAE